MLVREIMSPNAQVALPDMTIREAARLMAELDAGALPVVDTGQLVGMVTDRDIVVRAVALGRDTNTSVTDVMTADIHHCREDDDVVTALAKMEEAKVRRLPVLDAQDRLVGIVSLGDVALETDGQDTGEALGSISVPGGEHSQSTGDDPRSAIGG